MPEHGLRAFPLTLTLSPRGRGAVPGLALQGSAASAGEKRGAALRPSSACGRGAGGEGSHS